VTIPANRTIVLDVPTAPLAGLTILGTLVAGDADVAITAGYVLVDGGRLEIGTAAVPFQRTATITLSGTSVGAPTPALMHFGNKVLAVHGGTLSLHGRPVTTAWTKLAADVAAGSAQLTLTEPTGWRAGDRIVIATSSMKMQEFDTAEIRSIAGTSVTLAQPLTYRHLGAVRRVGDVSVDVRAEVGLLSHNIVVQGDASSEASRIGGHAMFMNSASKASVQIARVSFRRMGQLNQLGRYPVHFHLMGNATGSYVRESAIDGSIQRGIVLHAVSGVQVVGNVVFNTVGHNVVVETENTTNNVLDRNLALVNRQPSPLPTQPELASQNDRLPSNYWFKSGQNMVTNNAAAGSFDSGFNYDGIGAEAITFRRNVAHASMGQEGVGPGDFDLAAGVLIVSEAPRPATDVIADAVVYHNAIGFWPEESGRFIVDRMVAADNDLHTENRGVGNLVTYRAPVFVGTLTTGRPYPGAAVHFQYGSDVRLESPVFANFAGGSLLSPTDIAEVPQAMLYVTSARVIGARPGGLLAEETITTFGDDALLPRGSYMASQRFAGAGCSIVQVPADDGGTAPSWKCPRAYTYSELDVRDLAAVQARYYQSTAMRRSDGLRFTGGMFGYSVVLDGGLQYEIERAAAKGHAVRLLNDMLGPQLAASTMLAVVLPVTGHVSGVFRSGTSGTPPSAPPASSRLRLATSAADFAANPLSTYLFDAAAKKLTVNASTRWIVVTTGAGTSTTTPVASCTRQGARDAAVAQLLAHARREPILDTNKDGRRNVADLMAQLTATEAACR